MRAHFAGDVAVTSDSVDKIEPQPIEARIDEFKQDPKNMQVVTEFIDDVLQKAETEAIKQQNSKNGKTVHEHKEKTRQSFTIPDFKNGKVVNRARGLVVRIFDAICNCANTAAAPAQRIKLRAKRASAARNAAAAAAATANDSIDGTAEEKTEINEKKSNKKQEMGKEKKHDKKKAEEIQLQGKSVAMVQIED